MGNRPHGGGARTLSKENDEMLVLHPPHPTAARLAQEKHRRTTASWRKSFNYAKLVEEARLHVPLSVAALIRCDVARTFASIPEARGHFAWPAARGSAGIVVEGAACRASGLAAASATLTNVLLAYEWKTVGMPLATHNPAPPEECVAYLQGCNLLAAMCIGFVGGREEEGFWLFLHLVEDILGHEYFSKSPPFLGYHADRAVVVDVVVSQAPRLAAALGPRLVEVVSMLTSRVFFSGFVGFMAEEPLLAFWESFLEGRHADYPRVPLIVWLAGLMRFVEDQVLMLSHFQDPDDLMPICFKCVQEAAQCLPDGWRPQLDYGNSRQELREPPDRFVQELRCQAERAWRAYYCECESRRRHEGHAQVVKDSLRRTAAMCKQLQLLSANCGP